MSEQEPIRVEASVKIYLDFDFEESRWVVSPTTVDGYPLDSEGAYLDMLGPNDEERDALRQADNVDFPTGLEIVALLEEAIAAYPSTPRKESL